MQVTPAFSARPQRITNAAPGAQSPKTRLNPASDVVSVRFGGETPARDPAIPWPEVPDEMANAIKASYEAARAKRDANPDERLSAPKEELLTIFDNPDIQCPKSMAANDQIVYRIFNGASYADIRKQYALDQLAHDADPTIDIPNIATLTIRANHPNTSTRQLLAKAISEIPDDDLKSRWIDLMVRDTNQQVQITAATQLTRFSAQERTDAKADELSLADSPGVIWGLTDALPAVSPRLRWSLINQLIKKASTLNIALDLNKGLLSFTESGEPKTDPTFQMLNAYVADMTRLYRIQHLMAGYNPDQDTQPFYNPLRLMPKNEHNRLVEEMGRELSHFNNEATQKRCRLVLSNIANDPDSNLAVLARDVLIFESLWIRMRFDNIPDPQDTGATEAWQASLHALGRQGSEYCQAYFNEDIAWSIENQTESFARIQQDPPAPPEKNLWDEAAIRDFEQRNKLADGDKDSPFVNLYEMRY